MTSKNIPKISSNQGFRLTHPLEKIHLDRVSMPIESRDRKRDFTLITDYSSKYRWLIV